ncbi:Clp protease N-terminal domain-containing protein [Labedaea rhizosphaerae]|uniref:ClpA/ClpB-like protein n=1 Tax=Labedaea rhizosphaerae TaxID=598644 RepID=A0A4R6SQH6_LABRH|nr:Clp protease N-terminal domain-containing protein [Labedaea rhizosphaerae]TDQ05533.1 ClpA/ClpB-like protein [Labedaea rhizosphaerae]
MFARFDKSAKLVVIGALKAAEKARSPQIAEEHVVMGLLDQDDSRAAVVLAPHRVPKDEVRRAYRDAAKVGGMSQSDAAALKELGIDLDEVIASVRRDHGDDALAAPLSGRRRGARTRGFTEDVRKIIVTAIREAQELGDRHLGDEHLLLALLSSGTVAADALAAHGVSYEGVRSQLVQMHDK